MIQFDYTIKDDCGLHARPAGELVKIAASFSSDTTIRKGEKAANAKKLFNVMMLAVKKGENITVQVSGDDEQLASDKIRTFLEQTV